MTLPAIAISGSKARRKGQPGRPALPGERYPSGRLKPVDRREGGPAPAEIKKTFEAALREIGRDPVVGTSLGLLFMEGKVAAPQLAAGLAFARLQGRYDRAIDRPCRSTRSPDYGAARTASSAEPMTEDEVAAVKDRHARMKVALGGSSHDGRRAFAVLERVCADDRACEGFELARLQAALDVLVTWFGIEARKGA